MQITIVSVVGAASAHKSGKNTNNQSINFCQAFNVVFYQRICPEKFSVCHCLNYSEVSIRIAYVEALAMWWYFLFVCLQPMLTEELM
jgi:hypothetical protein